MPVPTLLSASLLLSMNQPLSICSQDDRSPSRVSMTGVVSDVKNGNQGYCTLTLVGDACAVTAGHCLHVLGEAEFFTDSAGQPPQMPETYRYTVDKSWIRALQTRIGNDWSVVRLKPNSVTGLLAGKVHGFVEAQLSPSVGSDTALELHAVRKTSQGYELLRSNGNVLWTESSIIFHDLDTGAGSSGALILDSATGRAVGIHTHGGCDTMKNNKATYIANVPKLVSAIKECRGY
ncbi:MAG: hypothetical protein EBR09_05525 [Proteobacteria bacterium]|nr:hypothetical protein [Pseudomonadota bacterium]